MPPEARNSSPSQYSMRHFSLFSSHIAFLTPAFSLSLSLSVSLLCWIVPAVLFLLSGVCVPQCLTQAPLTLLSLAVILPSVPNWLSAWRLSVEMEKHPSAREEKRHDDERDPRRSCCLNALVTAVNSNLCRGGGMSGRMCSFLFRAFFMLMWWNLSICRSNGVPQVGGVGFVSCEWASLLKENSHCKDKCRTMLTEYSTSLLRRSKTTNFDSTWSLGIYKHQPIPTDTARGNTLIWQNLTLCLLPFVAVC